MDGAWSLRMHLDRNSSGSRAVRSVACTPAATVGTEEGTALALGEPHRKGVQMSKVAQTG